MKVSTKLASLQEYKKVVDDYDAFLFDCDGVIWLGGYLIPGVKETLEYLQENNKKLIFVTNNSSSSRKDYVKKFAKFGLSILEDNIFGSAYATAVYLSKVAKFDSSKKAFVIGGNGLREELSSLGIDLYLNDLPVIQSTEDLALFKPDPQIGAVVSGLDVNYSFSKLAFAHTNLIKNPGCLFIATNSDLTFPAYGSIFPGAGSVLASLKSSTSMVPTIIGKPHQTLFDCIQAAHDLDLSRTIMVGDRLDTDIQFGYNAGIDTLLVYTGIQSESETHSPSPTFTVDSLGNFASLKNNQ
jgi:4-nitrophenyl phosphatase